MPHESDDWSAEFELFLGNLRDDLRDGFDDDFLDFVDAAALLTFFTLQLEAVLLAYFFSDLDLNGLSGLAKTWKAMRSAMILKGLRPILSARSFTTMGGLRWMIFSPLSPTSNSGTGTSAGGA